MNALQKSVTCPPKEKRCTFCAHTFRYVRRDTLYCSRACRQAAYRLRTGAGRYNNMACTVCGKEIQTIRWDRMVCSSACRQRLYRQRKALAQP